MKIWSLLRKFLCILPLVSSVFIVGYAAHISLKVLALLIIIVVFSFYIYYEKKAEQLKYERLTNELKQNHLDDLSRQRHDAMNDIQVLLGYIKLDKKDKSIEYVDKIKARTQNESILTKLKAYNLYYYVTEMKLCSTKVTFELEIVSNTLNWKEDYSDLLISILSCYETYDVHGKTKEASLVISIVLDQHVHIQIEYDGELTNNSDWRRDVDAVAKKRIVEERVILTIDEQDINITFLA